ncbi:hypothetical protein [Acinetobacter baumannii]|uniref:hypothetical protein n=1 Tax=Acinetobacter baumannii TaxID=470 RepID=UPI00234054EA|nr:hypothetical protein [Acinetobacter baumannii]MDC5638990.1 hypothetical protein [Acinetobacter baumannii]
MFNEDEEKLAHENWYKNNDPIAYKFYRDLSPEFETDFYTSEIAWLARAKAQAVPENTEDWYLNEDEGLWLDHDGIDGTLCELGIGEVKPVKHKEYLITQSNTLYAARVWNSDDDHIAWKLFESEESALEAANYCKQMYEASESGAANE